MQRPTMASIAKVRYKSLFLRFACIGEYKQQGAETALKAILPAPYTSLIIYSPFSNCKVLVGWSHTSVGPKY